MIYVNPILNKNFETDESEIPVLVIENMDFFRNLMYEIIEEDTINEQHSFYIGNKEINNKKDIELINDVFNLEINTSKNLTKLYNYISDNKLKFGGIYTHFFSASKGDQKEMIELFKNTINLIGKDKFQMIHMISSDSYYTTDSNFDSHLRLGQLLFGIQEPNNIDNNLKKTFRLIGRIESIKDIRSTKYIGYSEKRKVKNLNHFNIAVVKLGYGDGFLKYNENTFCLINGKEFYISSISMDYTLINVDNSVKIGDDVEFYFDSDKFFSHFNKKIYEFLTNLSRNITRMVK